MSPALDAELRRRLVLGRAGRAVHAPSVTGRSYPRLALSHGRPHRPRRRARALLPRSAGAAVRPCRLQRSQAGGGRRPSAKGARAAVPAGAGVAGSARRSGRRSHRRRSPRAGARAGDTGRRGRRRAEARARRDRPGGHEGRHRRDPAGSGWRRGGSVGGRRLPHAHALRRTAGLQVGVDLRKRQRRRRRQGVRLRCQGGRRVLGLQVGGRDTPRPACADDGVPGSHSHVDGDRGRHAGGRGGGGRDRPGGPEDRRLPVHRRQAGRA